MRFKVDENLHEEVAELLRQNGHDAISVYDQQMQGRADGDVAAVCRSEGRAILTQDLDFSSIFDYPPGDYAGIIVLRLHDSSRRSVLAAMRRLLPLLSSQPLSGYPWMVDDVDLRIRQGDHP